MQENNSVELVGVVKNNFIYDHELEGNKFYKVEMIIMRQSNTPDTIPLILPEKIIDVTKDYQNKYIQIKGECRTYNKYIKGKNRVYIYIYTMEIQILGNDYRAGVNEVYLEGFICKKPIYRKTPKGRYICDFILAVNRKYKRSDYIPCIAWGETAKYLSSKKVGDQITTTGRIQSREYEKVEGEKSEKRIAYEVSVKSLIK